MTTLATPHPTLRGDLLQALKLRQVPLAIVGTGYVGLPLASCMARHFQVIAFDIDRVRIAALLAGHDATGELTPAQFAGCGISFTDDCSDLRNARFIIVTVPTPVDSSKRPDFSPLIAASATIGRNLSPGSVVVFESTVYPGATEEVCIPVIERESGLVAGIDFFYGYSPERINPGDKERPIESIRKVVSGNDAATLEVVAEVYATAIAGGVHRAESIKVAEAAKVIENTQRDLNIALINELAQIFHRLGIDTQQVLEAAGTKWNFLPFRPGLVGGHCIGVDPYYLVHKAQAAGYHPQLIPAGRRINEDMGRYIAQECVRLMLKSQRQVDGGTVLILGLTFKENCRDVRNTRIVDIIDELRRFGAKAVVVDPVADAAHAQNEYGIDLQPLRPLPRCAAVIAAVAHREFLGITADDILAAAGKGAPFLDIKSSWDAATLSVRGLRVWRL